MEALDISKMQDPKTMTRLELETEIVKYRKTIADSIPTLLDAADQQLRLTLENNDLHDSLHRYNRLFCSLVQGLGQEKLEQIAEDNKDAYDNAHEEFKRGKVPTIFRIQKV